MRSAARSNEDQLVTTAGRETLMVSRPPSTSRVTFCAVTVDFRSSMRTSPAPSPSARPSFGRSGCCRRRSPACRRSRASGSSFSIERFQALCDGERLKIGVGLDQDAPISAHCQRGADGFLRLLRTDGNGDDFISHCRLLSCEPLLRRQSRRRGSSTSLRSAFRRRCHPVSRGF